MTEVDLVDRNECMLGGADEGVQFSGFLFNERVRRRERAE
jgi:hypothetical protein